MRRHGSTGGIFRNPVPERSAHHTIPHHTEAVKLSAAVISISQTQRCIFGFDIYQYFLHEIQFSVIFPHPRTTMWKNDDLLVDGSCDHGHRVAGQFHRRRYSSLPLLRSTTKYDVKFSSLFYLQKLKLILPTEFCDGAFQSSLTDSLANLATTLDIATDVLS